MERLPYPKKFGIPILPAGIAECYETCRFGEPVTDTHHLHWPKANFRTPIERGYREAGQMVVDACRCKHEDLHATYHPPRKPNRQTMIDVAQTDLYPVEAEVYIRRRDE